jgi:hypothetical protein
MMEGFSPADLFFWLAAGAVIVLSAVWLGILWYAWGVLRRLREIAALVETHTKLLADDLDEIRSEVRVRGWNWLRLYRLLVTFFRRKRKGR